MTGKQLKAFAAKVDDAATIEVRERNFGTWEASFSIHAVIEHLTQDETVKPPAAQRPVTEDL